MPVPHCYTDSQDLSDGLRVNHKMIRVRVGGGVRGPWQSEQIRVVFFFLETSVEPLWRCPTTRTYNHSELHYIRKLFIVA